MARIQVRYLTSRPGAAGEPPRYFWQPSPVLRAEGWRGERVPLDWGRYTDPEALRAAAIARAEELNAHLDDTRQGRALAAVRPATGGRTLGDLIRAYQASPDFTGLRASTIRGYRQCLRKLEAWGADISVRAIDAVAVQELQQGLAATPSYANAVVRVLRLLLEHGRTHRVPGQATPWVTLNHAIRPDLAGTEAGGIIWPRDAVAQFVATADQLGHHSVGTAVLLNEWFGQREGDILRMPRSIMRNGSLVLRQSKTGATVTLPYDMVAELEARLLAELARVSAHHAVIPAAIIVSEETGAAYKADHFRHLFARIRARLAETTTAFEIDYLLPGRDMADPGAFLVRTTDLTFMRLRHTAVTRLAEAGNDVPAICSVTGHAVASAEQILQRYMVRTAQLARGAFQKRLDAEAPPANPGEQEQQA